MTNQQMQFLIYNAVDEELSVNAVIKDETIWLTQKAMAELFGCSVDNISLHLKNIFNDGELHKDSTIEKISIVQKEGNRSVQRAIEYYNLDAIISVGYRVNSKRATKFRQWATSVLKEYMTKGFIVDSERLKQGETIFGKDYFRELLETVRSIRASERRIWQQITDIFAECSTDYDNKDPICQAFYAEVQNKFHYAITGKTAAEIVFEKADHNTDNMGLTTWKNAPDVLVSQPRIGEQRFEYEPREVRKLLVGKYEMHYEIKDATFLSYAFGTPKKIDNPQSNDCGFFVWQAE